MIIIALKGFYTAITDVKSKISYANVLPIFARQYIMNLRYCRNRNVRKEKLDEDK